VSARRRPRPRRPRAPIRGPLEGKRHDDIVTARVVFRNVDSDDFIIVRSGRHALVYQMLRGCFDDHDMRITNVIRGDDLLASTPRQVLPLPRFRRRAAGVRDTCPDMGLDK